jgi:hypothetical protein
VHIQKPPTENPFSDFEQKRETHHNNLYASVVKIFTVSAPTVTNPSNRLPQHFKRKTHGE